MSAEIYHFFGVTDAPNRIRELRLAAQPKLSQQSLADLVGVSKPTISDLENGKMTLTQDYMRRLARALHVLPATSSPCPIIPMPSLPKSA
jgi:transcriptional regulator with XRE-family HTH domain